MAMVLHSLIKHIMIKSSAKIIYDTDNLNNVVFTKNLLEYSDDFVRSVLGKNSFWYLDTDGTTANTNTGFEARRLLTRQIGEGGGAAYAAKDVNVIIPLNRYSVFEELESNMLPPMQLQFNIELNDDAELIHKTHAADAGRVVVNRFIL